MVDPDELQTLKERLLFQGRLDEFLESAGSRRVSLEAGLKETLPAVARQLGASVVWIETLDESLTEREFAVDGEGEPTSANHGLRARARELTSKSRTGHEGELVACRLDVAGEHFGTMAARCPDASEHTLELLLIAAEVFDNYLAAIRDAREKQTLLRQIHQDLSEPVLHQGAAAAVRRIMNTVRFDLLIVLYHLEDDYQDSLHYLVFRGPELEFSSRATVAAALDEVLHAQGLSAAPGGELLVQGAEFEHRRVVGQDTTDLVSEEGTEELLGALGYCQCLETVLIAGLDESQTVGKLVVGSRRPLSTYERDIFDLFSDVLQKRVVDFNKVGKLLHRTFPIPTVMRLLEEPDPMARLVPQSVNDVSILFADVASFTRLSEQILRDPVKVGAFIEAWSRGATQALWKHGGCFDKLVGDCIIGLFGPPYYESTPAERALACLRASVDVARFTNSMLESEPSTADILAAGEPLGVATGLNHCPASVGAFGLNRNFTAFAPGMNNAARLQSLAVRDEVLVMEQMKELVSAADPDLRFGERREGKVKNVADPLVFYALDLDSVQT